MYECGRTIKSRYKEIDLKVLYKIPLNITLRFKSKNYTICITLSTWNKV